MPSRRTFLGAMGAAACAASAASSWAQPPALPLDNLGLEHLDIVVPDPAATAKFYARVFKTALHQQPLRDTIRYFVLLGALPADRQVGYIAIGQAAQGRTPSIGHYCTLAKTYDRAGMGRVLDAAGFRGISGAGGLGMWPDPDGLELQLFQPPAGLVTAAVPSSLPEGDGMVTPIGVDHVLLHVSDVERSLPYYRLVYGARAETPRDKDGRVWFRLERNTRIGLQTIGSGETPRIGHYAVKVAPFDRGAVTARLQAIGAKVLSSADEPDVLRFADDNGIVVELRG